MAAPTLAPSSFQLLRLILLFFLTLILHSLLPQLFAFVWTRFMRACDQSPFRRLNIQRVPKSGFFLSEFKEKFVVSRYEGEMGNGEAVECGVCLYKISHGAEIRELGCKHLFHRHCLDDWCSFGNTTCPFCRRPLSPPVPEVDRKGEWRNRPEG
ncbi:hypothetical protein H6P81_003170 [Aristolochia fimbriata]|uniref:RING-type domain-containing protein n=1 Tax=Aristolochia fimbriata TaxID=158543 RepID=A0AAV7FBT5_ARIFI|nr:hypothetical protein H6P81_003170 [Aristolochia fimbriata]